MANTFKFEIKNESLENDAKEIKENMAKKEDKLKIWKNDKEKLVKENKDCKEFIKKNKDIYGMINLIKRALDNKEVFIFHCYESAPFNDKNVFIQKLKEIESRDIHLEVFNFDSEHSIFKDVKDWAVKLVENEVKEATFLKAKYCKIIEKDKEIYDKRVLINSYEKELKNQWERII